MNLDLEGKNNPNVKLCSVCGLKKELTYEHLPPKAAFNSNPVVMKDLRHITKLGGNLYGKSKRRPRGMGDYKLCKECNNLTGSWYASEYSSYVQDLVKEMKNNVGNERALIKLKIRPLNFLKQVLVIMLCADQALGQLRETISESNFILDKYCKILDEKICVYNFITFQPEHVLCGLTFIMDDLGSRNIAQFVFRPLGFFLTYDSHISENGLMNITNYKNFNYDEEYEMQLQVDLSRVELT